jgi:hypothetical protein
MGASVSVPKTSTTITVVGDNNLFVTGTSVPTVPTITNPITTEMNPVTHNLDVNELKKMIEMLHDDNVSSDDLIVTFCEIEQLESKLEIIDRAVGTALYKKSSKSVMGQMSWTPKLNGLLQKSLAVAQNITSKGIDCPKTAMFKKIVSKSMPFVIEQVNKLWARNGYTVRGSTTTSIPDTPYEADDERLYANMAKRMFSARAEQTLYDVSEQLSQLILDLTPGQSVTENNLPVSKSDAMFADRMVCPGGTSLTALVAAAEVGHLGTRIEAECAADIAAATGSTPTIALNHPAATSKDVLEMALDTGDVSEVLNEISISGQPFGYAAISGTSSGDLAEVNAVQHVIDDSYVDGITAKEIEENKKEFNAIAIHNIGEMLVTKPSLIPQSMVPRMFSMGKPMTDVLQASSNDRAINGITTYYATNNFVQPFTVMDAMSTDNDIINVNITHVSNYCYSRNRAYDGYALTLTCAASVVGKGKPVILFKSSYANTEDIYALQGHRSGTTSTYNFSLPMVLVKEGTLFGTRGMVTFALADGQDGDSVCFDDAQLMVSRDDKKTNVGHYIFNGQPTDTPLLSLLFQATPATLITTAPLDAATIWSEICSKMNSYIPNAITHIRSGKMHIALCAFAKMMDATLVEPPSDRNVTLAEAEAMMIQLINEMTTSFQYNGAAALADFAEEHVPKVIYRVMMMIYHAARAYVYSDSTAELSAVCTRELADAATIPEVFDQPQRGKGRMAIGYSKALPSKFYKMYV